MKSAIVFSIREFVKLPRNIYYYFFYSQLCFLVEIVYQFQVKYSIIIIIHKLAWENPNNSNVKVKVVLCKEFQQKHNFVHSFFIQLLKGTAATKRDDFFPTLKQCRVDNDDVSFATQSMRKQLMKLEYLLATLTSYHRPLVQERRLSPPPPIQAYVQIPQLSVDWFLWLRIPPFSAFP